MPYLYTHTHMLKAYTIFEIDFFLSKYSHTLILIHSWGFKWSKYFLNIFVLFLFIESPSIVGSHSFQNVVQLFLKIHLWFLHYQWSLKMELLQLMDSNFYTFPTTLRILFLIYVLVLSYIIQSTPIFPSMWLSMPDETILVQYTLRMWLKGNYYDYIIRSCKIIIIWSGVR